MAKLFFILLSLELLAVGCERSAQNVETTACDPKKSKCAGSANGIATSSGGGDSSSSGSTGDGPAWSPDPETTPTPTPSSESTTGGSSTGGSSSSGGSSPTGGESPTGGGSPTTGGSSSTGGESPTGGSSPTGGESPTGGSSPTGGESPTGGAPTGGKTPEPEHSPSPSPHPQQTMDPTFVDKPLGVMAAFDATGNLKLVLPQQQGLGKFSDMTYAIGVGAVPGDASSGTVDTNGIYDAGPIQMNLRLFFKFDGKDCQSETIIAQGTTTPVPVATRCHL